MADPVMLPSKVVLPHPEGPRMPMSWPAANLPVQPFRMHHSPALRPSWSWTTSFAASIALLGLVAFCTNSGGSSMSSDVLMPSRFLARLTTDPPTPVARFWENTCIVSWRVRAFPRSACRFCSATCSDIRT